jgi:divalent metal cation (Fe/Co/Zn/Cd) transporter
MNLSLIVACIIFFIALLIIWDAIWKLIACWYAARNDQMAWFIVCAVVNSLGVLPIIYLLWFQKEVEEK